MLTSLFNIALGLVGLGFLIFIHELGHYFMAKRVGMRVETFSIGFGKPIYSWMRNGTRWQIGWLFFGGFVKIAGTDTQSDQDPYQVSDGFFGKTPLDRILVALAGPAVNLLFALLLFGVLWSIGGRTDNFAQHTHKIGWVDPQSALYREGVRPGDEISAYNDKPFNGSKDHLQAPMFSDGPMEVAGRKIDYRDGGVTPFLYTVQPYPHPRHGAKGLMTVGILEPANYIMYQKLADGQDNPLPAFSPMADSGLQYGDRVVWVDGALVFSSRQLDELLNDGKALVTVQRQGVTILRRVPRVPVGELKLDPGFRNELTDWQFEADLKGQKLPALWAIPYNLTNDAVVEHALRFIDKDSEKEAFPKVLADALEEPLQEGDRIVAVDGQPVTRSWQVLKALQGRRVHVIVQRDDVATQPMEEWLSADSSFDKAIDVEAIDKLARQIGSAASVPAGVGAYRLLRPVSPITSSDFLIASGKAEALKEALATQQRQIDSIADAEQRAAEQRRLQQQQERYLLGIPAVQDRKVQYNPGPLEMFGVVLDEIWQMLAALFTGTLGIEWVSGPVGIVQAFGQQTMGKLRDAVYLLGAISLNLGIINLLPIPVLDGGTILFSLFEMVTGRRISPKTMERLILPFAVLLIGLILYITLNDVTRIFKNFL